MRGVRSTEPVGSERKSPRAAPWVTAASVTTSATECPVVPWVENSIHRGRTLRPIAPMDGLYPTSPHAAAGPRTLPPPSEVVAIADNPAASAAALPPLEPPLDFSVFHGLRVAPNRLFTVVAVAPNSGVFVRPTRIAPSAVRRSMMASDSVSGAASAYSVLPNVVRRPRMRTMSFTRTGSPASAPVRGCDAAAASASSAQTSVTAFSPAAASIRRSDSCTRSTGSIVPLRTCSASSLSITRD